MNNFDPETKEYYVDGSKEILINQAVSTIKNYCNNHPTCEGCSYNKSKVLGKPGGCYFRYLTPREWNIDN